MLPSTGHFKGINCPFLESGLCERPYCHFKHAKREAPSQPLLRRLVTSAVKRLMRSASVEDDPAEKPPSPPAAKPTYNPTPISELNKNLDRDEDGSVGRVRRHIPIPYTPSRPIRSTEGYVPFGGPPSSTATYNPGGAAQPRDEPAYSPVSAPVSSPSPVPTPSPAPYPFLPQMTFMRYKPTPLHTQTQRDTPVFSSDEDEPAAKKTKTDEVDLDGMESEFEMIGKIIDDEKETSLLPDEKRSTHLKEKNHKSSSSKSERSRKSESTKKSDGSSSKDRRSSRKDDDKKKRDSRSDEKRNDKSSRTSKHESSDKRNGTKNGTKSKTKDDRSSKHRDDRKRDRIHKETKVQKGRDETKKPERRQSFEEAVSEVEDVLSASESDEDKITEECMKIFKEYVPTPKENTKALPVVKNVPEDDPSQIICKKRIARSGDRPPNRTPVSLPPNHKGNAIQLAVDRYSKVKQFHEARLKSKEAINKSAKSESSPAVPAGSSKIRIAHVPNVSTMLNAKKNIVKIPDPPKVTSVQTVAKGTARVAHMPNEKFCERPGVLEPLASKIPVSVRSNYLNMMIDECLKIYFAIEDAYHRAQQEELTTSKKCKATQIYKNSAILAVNRLRKEVKETNGIKISNSVDTGTSTISHDKILVGKIGEKSSWSIKSKSRKDFQFTDELKGIKFYNNIARWLLDEKQLQDNGFPRPNPHSNEKGRAIIYTKNTRQKPPKGNLRTCCRCGKEYAVDKKGFPITKEECIYHPNNKYRYRGEVKYQCCGQDGSSDGCLSASTHVYEYVNHDDLRGYVRTLPKDDDVADHGVYALDCEMCYTTHGLDLTRVTVIDSSCKVVYESLVKPFYPIIDYNTRYSGLTEEMFSDCNTTLPEVQATFLHMFSNKTILVGHSLESDFKALKLIHDSIVDTSVLFPHKMGLPYKRALRNLSSEYLKKIIQNSVDGHDSAEDALVCMELIIWKLKEELKLR